MKVQQLTRGYREIRGSRGHKGLQRDTKDLKVSQCITKCNRGVKKGYRGFKGLQGGKTSYKGLQGVTRGYKRLQGVTVGYKKLQGDTRSYKG